MKYTIYPPIGFARLGNSPSGYFVGPEVRDSLGVEIANDYSETPVESFKDADFRMKRQGARFHIFEVPEDGASARPAVLPEGSTVQWGLELKNKKDAIIRLQRPPSRPMKVDLDPSRSDRLIHATAEVEGAKAGPSTLNGKYRNSAIYLGEIRTDGRQRLIVLGGRGRSDSLSNPPASIGRGQYGYYNNPDWFDDIADGPVTATLSIPGQPPAVAEPAWVIVAPPDFAPVSLGVVTLYDVIYDIAINEKWLQLPNQPYFETDIRPLIERTHNLRWVHDNRAWPAVSVDWEKLRSQSQADMKLRTDTAKLIRYVEQTMESGYGRFELRGWQKKWVLDNWASGNFSQGEAPNQNMANVLTRSALDGTVGEDFFPGIEAGMNIQDPEIYLSSPFDFRFDHDKLEAGDLTAHMALPWQADFKKCASGWWPAQRPNTVVLANGTSTRWLRPNLTHRQMVDEVMKLGVVSSTSTGKIVERGRDKRLGP